MDRIAKRCFVASLALHGTLLGVVLVGAAFSQRSRSTEVVPVPPVLIPGPSVDAILNGVSEGSSLPPNPTPSTPHAPRVVVTPPAPVPPSTPRASKNSTPREEKPVNPVKAGKPIETVDNNAKSLVSTVLVKRPRTTEGTISKNSHDSEARKATDKSQHQRNSDIDHAMDKLASLSNDRLTMSDMPGTGSGGSGPVNYRQAVLGAFDDAWNPPAEITDNVAVAVARITVHRSGKLTDARIIKGSNNALMDRSVQSALEAVKSLPPFPQGATDLERVFNIEFNLKAKRATG